MRCNACLHLQRRLDSAEEDLKNDVSGKIQEEDRSGVVYTVVPLLYNNLVAS